PSLSVTATIGACSAGLVPVTVTPGSTPPCSSRTNPRRLPSPVCAEAGMLKSQDRTTTDQTKRRGINPPRFEKDRPSARQEPAERTVLPRKEGVKRHERHLVSID